MGDLTLAQAKKKAAQAFKEAREVVLAGQLTPRQASREVIDIYWGLYHRLGIKARVVFTDWFNTRHEKLGSELMVKRHNS